VRPVLKELIHQLALEQLEVDLFRGQSQDLGWGTVFGGQVLGQALSAAQQTVPDDRTVHSMHGYFLRPGDVSKPIIYEVDRIRDGKSFTTRRVVAVQGGRAIFSSACSFQVEEGGLDHHDPMPVAPPPESVPSEIDLAMEHLDKVPSYLRARAIADRPIEFRLIDWGDLLNPAQAPPHRMAWLKAADPLPDDPKLHHFLLAYASDFHLLGTAMLPHGVNWMVPGMQVASLDHAMYFHRPFRVDEWLLYVMDGPNAAAARGLAFGRVYDRAGRLVATTVQEGLIRDRRDAPPRPRPVDVG
jgi:acyl-CoA thioesterase-2